MEIVKGIENYYLDRTKICLIKNEETTHFVRLLEESNDFWLEASHMRSFDSGVVLLINNKVHIKSESVDKLLDVNINTLGFPCQGNTSIFYFRDENEKRWLLKYDLQTLNQLATKEIAPSQTKIVGKDIFLWDLTDNLLTRINYQSLEDIWQFKFDGIGFFESSGIKPHKRLFDLTGDSKMLFFAFDGAVGCLDAETGKQLWLHEFDNVRMYIQDIGDRIYVPLGGSFYYLDKETGEATEQKWMPTLRQVDPKDGISQEIWSFNNKNIYHDGYIYAHIFDRKGKNRLLKANAETGEHIAFLELPKFGDAYKFEVFDNHIYILANSGDLIIIDPQEVTTKFLK